MSILSSALPYPSFPALCRKDTTYPWSNRLRSHYNIVMMTVMMMMVMVMMMMIIIVIVIVIIIIIVIVIIIIMRDDK